MFMNRLCIWMHTFNLVGLVVRCWPWEWEMGVTLIHPRLGRTKDFKAGTVVCVAALPNTGVLCCCPAKHQGFVLLPCQTLGFCVAALPNTGVLCGCLAKHRGFVWLPCQTPGFCVSVIGPPVLVAVDWDGVRYQFQSATSISMHVPYCAHAGTHACTHAHTYTHTRTHMHTHTHTHTRMYISFPFSPLSFTFIGDIYHSCFSCRFI